MNIRGRLRRTAPGPRFATTDVKIGAGTTFGRDVQFNCERVRIGDGCVIGDGVRVHATMFELGDFATVYPGCFFPGPGELRIGHNFWLGSGSIIDSMGGTVIGDNCGIGAQSQLWTHIAFGDVAYGCRFHSDTPLTIGKDVWFVGHCLVSPITAGDRSMAMLGSVLVKDMEPDHTYAGSPAVDMTERFGPQFAPTTSSYRVSYLEQKLREFGARSAAHAEFAKSVVISDGPQESRQSVFDVTGREYSKTGSDLERGFVRFLLPDAKFTPADR